ncbi:hypothetical protein M3Y14_34455 (plasmid) [Bacillus thuringiensis]|uniref:hypothetical protein n=1 Tax=Bacillus thuringiensis TaxID=1428 RepID=UPI002223F5C3|nr:hypothetical protein [Bacillus thuringiensis]UYX56086.1 hypothetical protein M3Y14_34455 [Bacillus thuringiensis]
MNLTQETIKQLDAAAVKGLFSKKLITDFLATGNTHIIIPGYTSGIMIALETTHLINGNNFEIKVQHLKTTEITTITVPCSVNIYEVIEDNQRIVHLKDIAKGDIISRCLDGSNYVKIIYLKNYNDNRKIEFKCSNLETEDTRHYSFMDPEEPIWLFNPSIAMNTSNQKLAIITEYMQQINLSELSDHNRSIMTNIKSIIS